MPNGNLNSPKSGNGSCEKKYETSSAALTAALSDPAKKNVRKEHSPELSAHSSRSPSLSPTPKSPFSPDSEIINAFLVPRSGFEEHRAGEMDYPERRVLFLPESSPDVLAKAFVPEFINQRAQTPPPALRVSELKKDEQTQKQAPEKKKKSFAGRFFKKSSHCFQVVSKAFEMTSHTCLRLTPLFSVSQFANSNSQSEPEKSLGRQCKR